MRTHCCSSCTATGGWRHSKRCRDKTKWLQRSIDPYKNWQSGTRGSSQDRAGWWHQGWMQQRWAAQDWIDPVQEDPNENDADLTDGEKAYDKEGKLMQDKKEKQ
eukprot:705502-Heterocapsa_arctica.AAC.1